MKRARYTDLAPMMSTRVYLPRNLADWISTRLPLGDLNRIQFRIRRRIPFAWLVGGQFSGLTLWNRVYVIESCWISEPLTRSAVELVLHELVHVAQYRRNPILFPLRYLISHLKYGYDRNPAEVEARETAARLADSFSAAKFN